MAMTGFVNHTKMPLRLAVFAGLLIGCGSLLVALVYLVLKLVYWNTFSFGMAPLMIGLFFFSAVQLIFIGIIGEYIGAIWTQVKNRPLVIEEERINFDKES
jgi:glycosyltransferase involved in cell wall biosynthesis